MQWCARAREAIENLVRCEDLHLTVADQRVHRCVTEVGHVVQRSLERVMDGRPADSVTLEELTARAEQRLELCFTDEWNRKRDAFVANPSAIGGWDLDFDRFFAMAKRGLAQAAKYRDGWERAAGVLVDAVAATLIGSQ